MKKQHLGLLVAGAWLTQLVYTVLPIDLIPDLVPIIGWIDDLLVLGGAITVTGAAIHLVRSQAHNPELAEPYAPWVDDDTPRLPDQREH
jgi:uncharacterized membrane protein YkvA (DUF1232 family)